MLSVLPHPHMAAPIKANETTTTNSKRKLWKPHWITWARHSLCPTQSFVVHIQCHQFRQRHLPRAVVVFAVFIAVSAIIRTDRALPFDDRRVRLTIWSFRWISFWTSRSQLSIYLVHKRLHAHSLRVLYVIKALVCVLFYYLVRSNWKGRCINTKYHFA